MLHKQNTDCPNRREMRISNLSCAWRGCRSPESRETPPSLLNVTVRLKLLMVTVVVHIYRAPPVCVLSTVLGALYSGLITLCKACSIFIPTL